MKTLSVKPKDISRQWYILDAGQTPLGRISTTAARLLIGKDKPHFSHHIDVGDYVIIVNVKALIVSGNKQNTKLYYRHSGFPGGLYKRTLQEQMERDPIKVVTKAVRGMLPVNKLRKARLARLKIYLDAEHEHKAQNPQKYEAGAGK